MKKHPIQSPKEAEPERLTVVSSAFSRYRAAEMGICLLAVILGLLYRFTGWISMGTVLVSFTVGFACCLILRILEKRRLGQRVHWFGIVFGAIFTLITLTATILYFVLHVLSYVD